MFVHTKTWYVNILPCNLVEGNEELWRFRDRCGTQTQWGILINVIVRRMRFADTSDGQLLDKVLSLIIVV